MMKSDEMMFGNISISNYIMFLGVVDYEDRTLIILRDSSHKLLFFWRKKHNRQISPGGDFDRV